MRPEDIDQDICITERDVRAAEERKINWARKCRRLSISMTNIMEDIADGIYCPSDRSRAKEIFNLLKDHFETLWLWDDKLTTHRVTLADLRHSQASSFESKQSNKDLPKASDFEQ